ncbi:hypothetical protein [Neobacillus soli]|uniref:hypothetical protein n=1 Tax=Neobacillus soli TaxID=220688 RepID=UPI000824C3AF|nr:hypothetical protein [Neobacillus soli]
MTGINYNPIGCLLTLNIDAKITYEHPKAKRKSSLEESFENITILFEGVQYLRMINSLHLLENPNDDLGSIEHLQLKSSDSISQGFSIIENENRKILSLDLSEGNVINMLSTSKNLSFLNFVSEMITFEIGFENYSVVVG